MHSQAPHCCGDCNFHSDELDIMQIQVCVCLCACTCGYVKWLATGSSAHSPHSGRYLLSFSFCFSLSHERCRFVVHRHLPQRPLNSINLSHPPYVPSTAPPQSDAAEGATKAAWAASMFDFLGPVEGLPKDLIPGQCLIMCFEIAWNDPSLALLLLSRARPLTGSHLASHQ